MALRLPIGNYVPGTTPVHKADTRVKLLLLVVYAVALFVVHSWIGLAILGVALVVMIILAKLGLRSVARGITPVLFILVFTFLANTITFYPIFAVSLSGALRGLYFVLRILFLVVATSLLTLTTPIVALTDAFTTLMRPLSKLKVPVEDIAMIISIAMRFIPITFDEAQKLIYAQRARGASFAKGGPIKRVKAYLPVLLPLLVNLFRKADDLAFAMEARCYVGRGRTRLGKAKIRSADVVAAAVGCVLFVATAVLF